MPSTTTAILNALKTNPPQRVEIKITPVAGSSFYLTEEQIIQNSCTVDRYVVSGDKIAYGTACAAELNFKIKNQSFNYNGKTYNPSDIKFEGARAEIWCVIDDLTGYTRKIPMGIFTIDEPPRKLSVISLTALDDMVKLDKPCNLTVLPTGAAGFVNVFNNANTGVSLSTNFISVLGEVYQNYAELSKEIPLDSESEELLWRQLFMYIAELAGGNLVINTSGKLDILFFPTSAVLSIDESMRFSSDIDENDITVTGITATVADTKVTVGSTGYEYNIENNKLITTEDTVNSMSGFLTSGKKNVLISYRPFTANIKSFPHLWPMDAVLFKKDGSSYFSILTHVTWTLNSSMSVESTGLNSTRNGYAKSRALTSKETAIIDRLAKETVQKISDFEKQVIDLNNKVVNTGKGLFHTEVVDENGAKILYTHDLPTLEESTYITMTTSAGFVFTSGVNCWNDGNPVWLYGYTDYGDMVMNTIAARKISTELLTIGSRNHETVVKNLVLNSSFDNGLEHWNHFTNSFQDDLGIWQYPFYSAEIVTSGDNKYLRLCPGDEYQYPHLDSDPIAVLPGKTYRVSFEVQCDVKALMPRVQADVYNSSDKRMSYKVSPSISSADNFAAFEVEAGKFTEHSFEITIPEAEDSYYVILRLFATKALNGALADNYFVRFDNVQLIGEMTEINGNIVITEDEISVYNGKITIYSDSSGGSPVFSANDDGTLKITGSLKAQGNKYDMVCSNVTYQVGSNVVDSQGLYQTLKGKIVTADLVSKNEVPYVRFVDVITPVATRRHLELHTFDDVNIFTSNTKDGKIIIDFPNIEITSPIYSFGQKLIGSDGTGIDIGSKEEIGDINVRTGAGQTINFYIGERKLFHISDDDVWYYDKVQNEPISIGEIINAILNVITA